MDRYSRISIMQPYFFPYIGYFALIKHVESFILFDTPQFKRHGWIERNQILKPNGETLYIKVPLVKHSRDTKINEIKIKNTQPWKNKILSQLGPYKKKAPNYSKVINLLNEVFELDTESIVEINRFSLEKVCQYLMIDTQIAVWSEMNVNIDPVDEPDEWALNISKALGAKIYFNPPGGMAFFDKKKFEDAEVVLKFMKVHPIAYKQLSKTFVPYLSIIDVLMFCDVKEVHRMLDNFTLIN